ncbi:diguanylate cyclase (GGDEF) domain-containing protein [Rhizobium sp. RU33A]|uniref:bifunctional diguanylate cyclase/phosphodiesterase n=1 Tax=Rhizobium sp. RU33A TaxID=1907413 RepID=UPI000953B756|nr:GGDEF domain-containing protein [Rhizobium sp. RU33A]SIQ83649.1 diguanylate cyclase (GGDEF) domain-containing protein [Rhizobium sp. RU33A]
MLLDVQNVVLKMLAEGEEPSNALDALCRWLEKRLPSTIATILLVDDTGRLQPCAAPSLAPSFTSAIQGQPIGPFQGSCGAAAHSRQTITDIDLERSKRWRDFAHLILPFGLVACFSSPVLSRADKVIGTIALYFTEPRGPTPLEQSIVEGCLSLCMIVLEHKERVAEMQRLAYTDSVTGLPNRAAFSRKIEMRPIGPRSILLVDIDNLSQVNDTFGHHVGDALIASTAKRLLSTGEQMQAFRIGGDEFALVVDGAAPDVLYELAEEIRHACAKPTVCAGVNIRPSVTQGLAFNTGITQSAMDLWSQADQALYHAKSAGRGAWTVFDANVATAISKRAQAVQLLSDALAERRVEAWYQPICRLDTQELVGVEALARIRAADGSVVAAAQFHEATKDAQVAAELTRQMIACIARDVSAWISASVPFQHVGINVSASDLADDDFVHYLTEVFASTGIPLKHIILEITESVYLGDSNGRIAPQIAMLREAGFKIALDDFGTGYASLTHLVSVSVDIIKIDKSFIDLIGTDEASTAIVEGLLHIARRMGIRVVAEGIEHAHQERLLVERGCQLGQGYLYAKALPASEAAFLLKDKGQKTGPS